MCTHMLHTHVYSHMCIQINACIHTYTCMHTGAKQEIQHPSYFMYFKLLKYWTIKINIIGHGVSFFFSFSVLTNCILIRYAVVAFKKQVGEPVQVWWLELCSSDPDVGEYAVWRACKNKSSAWDCFTFWTHKAHVFIYSFMSLCVCDVCVSAGLCNSQGTTL